MTAAKRPQPENKPSFLISKDENDQLFKLIGPRCKSIATAVVQVCFADPPSHAHWNKRHCGILCFIKDNYRRSYFLRVYCLDRQAAVWEQELYTNFEYRAPRPYFHTFEGDNCRVGLNFADENEAEFFLAAIKDNLRVKTERRERRRMSQQQPPAGVKPALQASNGSASTMNIRPAIASVDTKKKNKKDKNRKLTKADIGLPSDFKHVSHVGWDPNQGFAIENVDPQLLQFLAKAGVSENHLKDKATRDFIYDFIDKHGGTEAAIREVSNQQSAGVGFLSAPPVPMRNTPSTPQSVRIAPPAPPASAPPPPPPPPSRIMANPAPPPQPGHPVPPVPPQRGPGPKTAPAIPNPPNIPPPPPLNSCPPPPPPPPMTSVTVNEVPPNHSQTSGHAAPPVPPVAPPQPDNRGALMNAIREGAKLKHIAPTEVERPRLPSVNDPRNDLLDQIRAGKDLKPVDKAASTAPPKEDALEGIAGALARALQERSRVIHSDSEESGQDEDEDDDWDD